MLQRLIASVVLCALPVGCSGRAGIAGGAATALTGGLMIAKASGENCPDGGAACELADEVWTTPIDRTVMVTGGALILVGAILIVYGMETMDTRPAAEPAPPPPLASAPALPSGPPATVEPTPRLPAETAIRSRMENQLAIQISVAARRGDCAAALATGDRLQVLDPALHDKVLAADAAYLYCRDQRQRM